MHDWWRYVVVGLVFVSVFSVGVTEAYRWSDAGTESGDARTDYDPQACTSGTVTATTYDGDPPETTRYGNLTAEQQQVFDAARTADNDSAWVSANASKNISSVDYVVDGNRTYFVRNAITDCPWNNGSETADEDGALESVFVPFFVIAGIVRYVWLPVTVAVGLYVGYRKWSEWIQFG